MADLNQLKQKYEPVIDTIQKFGAEGAAVQGISLDGEKLYLKATVPSTVVANRVWDVIKQVDPQYGDLHHEIVTSGEQSSRIRSSPAITFQRSANIFMARRTTIKRLLRRMELPTRTRSALDKRYRFLCCNRPHSKGGEWLNL